MRHPAELFSNVSGDERFERVQVCCEKEKQEALTVGDTRHSLEIRNQWFLSDRSNTVGTSSLRVQ
jgi:hypothetical protein